MQDALPGKKATAELIALLHEKDMIQAMQGLRPGADPALFCPSLYQLLQAALALPENHRAGALRARYCCSSIGTSLVSPWAFDRNGPVPSRCPAAPQPPTEDSIFWK